MAGIFKTWSSMHANAKPLLAVRSCSLARFHTESGIPASNEFCRLFYRLIFKISVRFRFVWDFACAHHNLNRALVV